MASPSIGKIYSIFIRSLSPSSSYLSLPIALHIDIFAIHMQQIFSISCNLMIIRKVEASL